MPGKIISETFLLQDPKMNGKTEDTKIVGEVQSGSYGSVAGANNISQLDHQVRSIMAPEYVGRKWALLVTAPAICHFPLFLPFLSFPYSLFFNLFSSFFSSSYPVYYIFLFLSFFLPFHIPYFLLINFLLSLFSF
jgi:hypothetical protein